VRLRTRPPLPDRGSVVYTKVPSRSTVRALWSSSRADSQPADSKSARGVYPLRKVCQPGSAIAECALKKRSPPCLERPVWGRVPDARAAGARGSDRFATMLRRSLHVDPTALRARLSGREKRRRRARVPHPPPRGIPASRGARSPQGVGGSPYRVRFTRCRRALCSARGYPARGTS
jgi:hypothetical protein